MASVAAELADSKAPRAIPTRSRDRQWEPLTTALTANWVRQIAEEKKIHSTNQLAAELTREVFSEQYIEQLVRDRVVQLIEQIVRSQNPNLSLKELQQYALRAAANLPEEMRQSIEPSARQQVTDGRERIESDLANDLRLVNRGTDLTRSQNQFADKMATALTAYKNGSVAEFNLAVADYRATLQAEEPAELAGAFVSGKSRYRKRLWILLSL